MRLFIAIALSEEVRAALAALQARLARAAPRISWIEPANLHLTLKFLGETPDEKLPSICQALSGLRGLGIFDLVGSAVQCFPAAGAVRAITVACEGGERLTALYEDVEEIAFDLGYRREGRAFRPHITLARVKSGLPAESRQRLSETGAQRLPTPSMQVTQVALYESHMHQGGVEYARVGRFDL